jgi:CheY-like chemotaxis protein
MKKYIFLVVDDIVMNRVLLRELLIDAANEVKEAKNGLEALELIKQSHIDIVFMDIEMPKMNGLETTRYIRKELDYPLNKIPVIALTAHNPNDFFEDFTSAGFDYLLTKPYSFEKIREAIDSVKILSKK